MKLDRLLGSKLTLVNSSGENGSYKVHVKDPSDLN